MEKGAGGPGERAAPELKIKAELSQMDRIRAFLSQSLGGLRLPDVEYNQIELALHEVCINIIRYGFPGRNGEIYLKITAEEGVVKIEIRDSGIPFDPSHAGEPDLEAKIRRGDRGGYGIFLSRQLMDEFDYRREDGENVLRLSKRI